MGKRQFFGVLIDGVANGNKGEVISIRILSWILVLFSLSTSVAFASPEVVLNIPEYTLRLVDGQKVLKRYDVAVGTSIEQTPVGKFSVFFKEINPTWYPASGFVDKTPVPPGPDNPL